MIIQAGDYSEIAAVFHHAPAGGNDFNIGSV